MVRVEARRRRLLGLVVLARLLVVLVFWLCVLLLSCSALVVLGKLLAQIPEGAAEATHDDALEALRRAGPVDGLLDDAAHGLVQLLGVVPGDAALELAALAPARGGGVVVGGRLHQLGELLARHGEPLLVAEVEARAEGLGQATDHVAALDRVHILLEAAVGLRVEDPLLVVEAAGVGEGNVGQRFDERGVQAPKVHDVVADDVVHLALVLGGQHHARVAEVAEAGDGAVEVGLGEVGRQEEHGGADGGDEVALIGEADLRVVAQDLDGLLEPPGQIEVIPRRQVLNQVVDAGDAVLDQHAIYLDIRVEVDAGTPFLDPRDCAGAQGRDGGVVVAVLLHVDGVPVLGVRDAEDEVDHLGRAALGLDQRLGWLGVDGAEVGLADAAGGVLLGEDTGAVGEAVDDGGVELAQHEAQGLLELVVDDHVLVGAEEAVGQVGEGLDLEVDAVLPVAAVEVELAAGGLLGARRG